MREKIELHVQKAIAESVFPGCVIGVVRKDGAHDVWPFGHVTYGADSPRVEKHTIYDVASVTKSIPTASLALVLIEERRLHLSDTLRKFLPELQNDRGATIKDLLTYTMVGVRLSTLKDQTPDEILAHVFECGFFQPSGSTLYTNLPAFLLGIIIERITNISLDILAKKHFFDPLYMDRTTFFPENTSEIVPTEVEDGGEVRGVPHDESARVFAKAGKAAGHAGLFSTVPDMLTFLEALLTRNHGFTKPVIQGAEQGFGWQVNEPRFMGKYAGEKTFGKTGFTGTSVVVDRERDIAFVILSNRTYPKRPPDDSAIFDFRRDIADIVFESV